MLPAPLALAQPEGLVGLPHKSLRARRHERRRSDRLPQVVLKEAHYALLPLQARDVNVQIHAVDAFHFQGHVL